MPTPEIKIPGQAPFAQPQGPSVYDQLSLDGKATVNLLIAIIECLKRIENSLTKTAQPSAQSPSA